MSTVDGGYFGNFETFSPDRVNSKTVTRARGVDIPNLFPTWAGQIATVIETGGGYTANTALMRNSTDSDWIGMSGGRHRHDADTDPAGGRYDDIQRANMSRHITENYASLCAQDLAQIGTVSISNEPSQARIRLPTSTTTGGYSHGSRSGGPLTYARRINFQWVGYVTAGSYVSVKIGVNMEDVNSTHTPDRKFGLEACDSGGTARNYDLVSASGSIRDIVATTEPVQQTANRGYILQHRPGLNARLVINGASPILNPNNVSSSGNGSGQRNVSMGIKTNNTTEKFMYVRLFQLFGGAGTDNTWWNLADP